MEDGVAPLVSVIVPAKDASADLHRLLERLAAQTLAREGFEVIVGDDGSREPLAALATADGWLRVTAGPPLTSYAARNRAAALARGAVLAFCDADCLPEPDWLEAGLAALQTADVVAGEVRFVAPAKPTAWTLLTVDMFLDQKRNVTLARAVTANLFVGRRLFEELGRFDESLPSGGDYDFVRRALHGGARLAYAPDAVVCHPTIDSGRAFLRKVRFTNHWTTARRVQEGQRPAILEGATVVPLVGVAVARRQALRPPFALERPRLAAAGLAPRRVATASALLLLYSAVPAAAVLGSISGWLHGRKVRTEAAPSTNQAVH